MRRRAVARSRTSWHPVSGFCSAGNPGLYSAAVGHHFARPGNRFWPALHRSGFVPRQLHPAEQELLLGYRLGITNVVARGELSHNTCELEIKPEPMTVTLMP